MNQGNRAKTGHTTLKIVLGATALALAALALWQTGWEGSRVGQWIAVNPVLGAAIYFAVVAASVVVLPFSSLPLLPIAAQTYGVFLTGLLSAAGWWAGCLVAFWIARRGRGLVERFASLDAIDRIEEKLPKEVTFGAIIVLRMILPVDLVSFALGLTRRLAFGTYATASLIGILPFAFVLSYAGGKLGAGQYLVFALVVFGVAALVFIARGAWKRRGE